MYWSQLEIKQYHEMQDTFRNTMQTSYFQSPAHKKNSDRQVKNYTWY